MQYKQAYLEAVQNYTTRDPALMAEAAGGTFLPEKGVVEIPFLDRNCRVSHPDGKIAVDGWPELPPEEKIIILQYLVGASGLPPRGQWLSFLQLPGGPHHFAPFQKEAILPLAREFGRQPENFRRAALSLGGAPAKLGQAGMIIPAFPLVPLGFALWPGDGEFEPSANILFDSSAETHMPTATLYMLGIAVAQRLLAYPGFPGRDWYEPVAPG